MDRASAIAIRLNPAAQVRLRRVGREAWPLLVIDDVLLDPEVLVELAAATPFGAPHAAYYPGLNAPMPRPYLEALMPVLRPSFARAYAIAAEAPMVASGFFALATEPVERLSTLQKIPHYDQVEPDALAMIHYLAHDQGGGTGFFSHRATGYEMVTPARRETYLNTLAAELETVGELTRFTGPETPNYAMLDAAEWRFNRLIIYPSNVLHCALFEGARLNDDPRTGRLTANSFFKPGV